MTVRPPHLSRAFDGLSLTDVVRFAGAAGDFNPVHHDPAYAAARGFAGPFVMGMLPAAIAAEFAAGLLRPAAVAGFEVRFAKPLYVGDSFLFEADETRSDDGATNLLINVSTGSGTVLTAKATTEPASPPSRYLQDAPKLRDLLYIIEEWKIMEFERSISPQGLSSPAAEQQDRPRSAPLLFLNTVQHRLGDDWYLGDKVGIPITRCLHGRSEWTFLHPIKAGDAIKCETRVVDDEKKVNSQGTERRFVTFETLYSNRSDVVQIERMTIVDTTPST